MISTLDIQGQGPEILLYLNNSETREEESCFLFLPRSLNNKLVTLAK